MQLCACCTAQQATAYMDAVQAAGRQLERVRQLQSSHDVVAQENERCDHTELSAAVPSACRV